MNAGMQAGHMRCNLTPIMVADGVEGLTSFSLYSGMVPYITGIKYFEVICTPVALNVAPAVYYLVPGIYSYNISAQVYISTYTLLLNTAAGLSNQ